MRKLLLATAVVALSWPGGAASAAGAAGAPADGPPDLPAVVDDVFAGDAAADVREIVGWIKPPTPIAVGDPAGDQLPLNPASAELRPEGADMTGFAFARTGPLDARSFDALLGPDGLLLAANPAIKQPTTYQLDPEAFRDGLQIAVVVPQGPPPAVTGADDVFTVAVESFDPRYPAPPSGTFQGINKVWRYDIRPSGSDVSYAQFDGSRFATFKSPTVVVDTCAADPQPGCYYAFFTALSSTATQGLQTVQGELFARQGALAAADRNGQGTGEMQAIASLVPGTLGLVPNPNAVAAPAPAAGPARAPAPARGVSETGRGAGGTGWVPIALLGTGVVLVGGGIATRVLAKDRPSVLEYMPAETTTTGKDTPAEWAALLAREEEIQQRLMADYQRIGGIVADQAKAFATALATYDAGYQKVAWNAQWLQGAAGDTLAGQKVAAGIDLVLGVGDAALSLWRLGTGGWRKVGPSAADAAADAGSAARAATGTSEAVARGNAVIARSEELVAIANEAAGINIADHLPTTTFMRGLDVVFAEAAALGDEAGVAFATVAPQRINELRALGMHLSGAVVALWVDMAEALAASRGWVKVSDDVRSVITEVAVDLRSFCRGGVIGSTEELRHALVGFDAISSQPGFWETLPKLYTVIGDARSADTAVELLYHADDVAFLRWASGELAAGHALEDLPARWQALSGPVAAAGEQLAAGVDLGSGAGTVLSVAAGVGDGVRVIDLFSNPAARTSVLPDGVTYVSQFGILRPTLFGFEAGDSAPLTALFNGVNAVGGFATWLTGFRGSIEGGLLYDDVTTELAPTFTAMATSSLDMVNALSVLGERVATDSIAIEDRNALQSVLDEMTALVDGAPHGVGTDLRPALDDRTAHITAKLAQLASVQSTLVTAANGLPGIASALDGALAGRTSIQWADPALGEGFAVAAMAVQLLAAGVLRPPVQTAADDTGRGPEVLDKAVPGSYLERSDDDPPDVDPDADEFFRRTNAEAPPR